LGFRGDKIARRGRTAGRPDSGGRRVRYAWRPPSGECGATALRRRPAPCVPTLRQRAGPPPTSRETLATQLSMVATLAYPHCLSAGRHATEPDRLARWRRVRGAAGAAL